MWHQKRFYFARRLQIGIFMLETLRGALTFCQFHHNPRFKLIKKHHGEIDENCKKIWLCDYVVSPHNF